MGVNAYLLTIPFGPTLPPTLRLLPLLSVITGLFLTLLGPSAQRTKLVHYRLVGPFLVFAASTLLAIVLSAQPVISAARSTYTPVSFLFFFAAQHIAANTAAVRRLCVVLCIVFLLLGIDGIWQFAVGSSLFSGSVALAGRVSGSMPHPNDLALVPILLPLLALLLGNGSRVARVLVVASVSLAFSAVLLSGSRNAWIGCAVGITALLLFARDRILVFRLALLSLGIFVLAVGFDVANIRERLASVLELQNEGRFGIWSVAWKMFREAPVVGKGAHLFAEYYDLYLAEIELDPQLVREARRIPWAHNLYLEFLAERGMVGLSAWLIVVAAALRSPLHALARGGMTASNAYAPAASLVVFLVMGLFDLTFLKDWVSLVFWLLIGLAAQLGRDVNGSVPPPKEPSSIS